MSKLRINARPDGRGWIDLRFKGEKIGSIKAMQSTNHLMVIGDLHKFCKENGLKEPIDN